MPQTELEALVFQMDVNISKMAKKMDKMTADTKKTSNVIQGHFDKAGSSISGNFTSAIEGAASQVPILGDALISLGGPALLATTAVAGLAIGLNQAQKAMNWADELQAAADHIGISAEALQELQFAAGDADVEVSAMQEGLKALNASLGAIQTGVGAAKIEKAFAAIGIKPEQLKGMNDASELLPLLADKISAMGTRAEQVQIAKKLGIEELLPMLQNGAGGLKEVTDRAVELGLVIDNQTVGALADMNREVEIAHQRIDAQLKRAFLDLAPAITGATTASADFLQFLTTKMPNQEGTIGWFLLRMVSGPAGLVSASGDLVKPVIDGYNQYAKFYDEAIRQGKTKAEAKTYAEQVIAQNAKASPVSSESVSVDDIRRKFGIKDPDVTPPSSVQATGAIQLVEALMAEDARLAKQYEDDKKKLAAGLKQREITQAQYNTALAELTREYQNKQSGAFVIRKDGTKDQEDLYGKIGNNPTLGTNKDRDINIIDPMMKLPEVVNPAREALEGLRSVSRDIAYDLGEAIAYGDDLGDALSHTFRRIAAEWITGGLQDIFNSLLGKSGSSGGGLLGSIISGIGGGITGARAGGGMVSGAGSYLVGEHGPEVFTPGLNGSIVNNNSLRALQGARAADPQAIRVQVEASPYFDVRVTQIAQPMSERAAQVGVYGGAQLARTQAAKQQRSEMS
ncbi:MAG: hypothetical protein NVV72_14665 [Asticcacaulis sp.]|nr:hypothetical protein [Asticcacaulis sp.]